MADPNEETITFPGADGHQLAAVLERPPGPIRACAVFAHCFTCSKDLRALRRIADALVGHGIAERTAYSVYIAVSPEQVGTPTGPPPG